MKGLVYKDILILIKDLKFALIMVAIFCLGFNTEFGLNRFFLMYSAMFLPMTLFSMDEATRWEDYAAMLPCSPLEIVLSRYIIGWLGLIFAAVFYFAGTFLPFDVSPDRISLVMVAGFALLFQGVLFPVVFRFGPTKGRLFSIFAIVVIAVVVWILYDMFESMGLLGGGALAVWMLLPLGALVCVASIPVSVRQYRKRKEL